jgi:tRNA-2-methylthio-N6-dimethylallyladenosine synthase
MRRACYRPAPRAIMATFSVVTFGCQMNVHDSTRMEEVLAGAGYRKIEDADAADVVILNTCSVREKAEQKLRSEVGRFGVLKRSRPGLILGVAGCVAQQEGERLLRGLPQIDLILGPDNIPELPQLLQDVELGALPRVRTVFDIDAPSFLMAKPEASGPEVSAFVTVMKGCNERCSYCIVPHTRGPERYRPAHEIIEECRRHVAAGAREITLLGQTVNSYRDPERSLPPAPRFGELKFGAEGLGRLRGRAAKEDETEFPALLFALAEALPDLWRLRYTSPHPRHLTPSLIEAHAALPVLAKHVHMPVQSGSNALLRRMIRRYTREEYLERTFALREAVPGLTLSTDMIVGFPGETEADFAETLSLVREAGFVSLFGFKYSVRPYTPAEKLQDDISEEEKSSRLARLFERVDAQKQRHLASLVGRQEVVLIDGYGKTGDPRGRTEQNEIVHLPRPASGLELELGALVRVEIRAAFKNSLGGNALSLVRPGLRPRARTGQDSATPSRVQTGVERRLLPVV